MEPSPPPSIHGVRVYGPQAIATGTDSSATLPPKANRPRTSMPIVLLAKPPTISTVAGSKGTEVSTDPRVATVAHAETSADVAIVCSPMLDSKEAVRADPRWGKP